MDKLIVDNDKAIVEISKALSNKNRLVILKYIISKGPLTLAEIHHGTSNLTGIKHRETTYKYVRKLELSNLIRKENKGQTARYFSTIESINFELLNKRK